MVELPLAPLAGIAPAAITTAIVTFNIDDVLSTFGPGTDFDGSSAERIIVGTYAGNGALSVSDYNAAMTYWCPKCGEIMPEPAAASPLAAAAAGQPRTRRLAIWSLVLALATLLCPPAGLVGLIIGILALVRISNSAGQLRGRGFAIAGIVVACVLLVFVPLALFEGIARLRDAANRHLSGSQLKDIGIEMEIVPVDVSVWFDRFSNGDYQVTSAYQERSIDPDNFYALVLRTGGVIRRVRMSLSVPRRSSSI